MKLHLGNLKKSIITSDSNHFQGGTSLSSAEDGASENSHLHTMSIKLASPFSAEFNAIQREVEQSIKVSTKNMKRMSIFHKVFLNVLPTTFTCFPYGVG